MWFIVFAGLAEHFPRSGDDWAWGSQEGLDRLPHFFQGVNGRYGGDLLALLLVRSGPATALVVSATVCATLFLVLHLGANRTPLGYAVAATLFLAMPRGTWREGVVWLSGFVNYGFAALALLCFLALIQAECAGRLRRPGMGRLAATAAAGFTGQLFMEHVTLGICAVGLGLSLLHRRRFGRWGPYTTTWTAAALVGAAVMFANPVYRRAVSGEATYQQAQGTSGPHALRDLLLKLFDSLPTQSVVANGALNAALVVLLVVLVVAEGRARTRSGRAVVVLSVGGVLLATALVRAESASSHVSDHVRVLASLVAALLSVALVLAAWTLIRTSERRWVMLVAGAAFIVTVGPLLLVNPIGPRCFYPTYVLMLVIATALGGELQDRVPALAGVRVVLPVQVVSVALMAVMFVVYISIDRAVDHRLATIRSAVAAGQTRVQLEPLPHPTYVHDGDPFWSLLIKRFKAYYDLPPALQLRLSPNPWLKKTS